MFDQPVGIWRLLHNYLCLTCFHRHVMSSPYLCVFLHSTKFSNRKLERPPVIQRKVIYSVYTCVSLSNSLLQLSSSLKDTGISYFVVFSFYFHPFVLSLKQFLVYCIKISCVSICIYSIVHIACYSIHLHAHIQVFLLLWLCSLYL